MGGGGGGGAIHILMGLFHISTHSNNHCAFLISHCEGAGGMPLQIPTDDLVWFS